MLEDKSRRMPHQSNGQASEPFSHHKKGLRNRKANKIPKDSGSGGNEGTSPTGQRSHARSGGYGRRWSRNAAAEMQKQTELHRQRIQRLEKDIQVRLSECALSEEDTACIERCIKELEATVQELGSGWCMKVFGSLASAFCTSGSDVDATCLQVNPSPDEETEAHNKAALLIERLGPLLLQHGKVQIIEEIPSAKVPILRLRFENRLDIDLSCQNTEALRNTRLLRAYASLDPRVRQLGVAVKLWAKAARVCGAAKGHLSSYTFTLMMIYFMQVYPDVQLPRLDPVEFNEESECDVKDLQSVVEAGNNWRAYCHLSVADLMTRFLYFYTEWFDWGNEVVSPRLGERQSCRHKCYQTLRGRWVSRIHVEDPYKLERNLHCVLGEPEEVQLREAFGEGWHSFNLRNDTPVGLRPLFVSSKGHVGWPDGMLFATTPILKEEIQAADPDGEADAYPEALPADKVRSRTGSGSPRADRSDDSTKSGGDAGGTGSSADDVGVETLFSTSASEPFSMSRTALSSWSDENELPKRGRLISFDDVEEKAVEPHRSQHINFSMGDLLFPGQEMQGANNTNHYPTNENEPKKNWWQNLGHADVQKAVVAAQGEQPEGKSARRSRRGRSSSELTAESDDVTMSKAQSLEAIESKMAQAQSLESIESKLVQARSLESVESDIVQSHGQVTLCLADVVEGTPKEHPASRHVDHSSTNGHTETEGSWRRFFPNLKTAEPSKADSMQLDQPSQPVVMTVEDLEEKMSQKPKEKPKEESSDKSKEKPKQIPCEKPKEMAISTLFGGSFAASTSSKIAARLEKQLKAC